MPSFRKDYTTAVKNAIRRTETKPLAMPKEIAACPSGFYDPELNAHFVHVASDSGDDGIMWVYRYKKSGE